MDLKLLKTIRSICPKKCTVKSIQINSKTNSDLVVITFPSCTITRNYDIYDWEIEQTHDLHHSKIRPLKLPEGNRVIYCCGNNFVLYSPCKGFLNNFGGDLSYSIYGDREYQRYVGSCSDIDDMISYLTTKEGIEF